MSVVHVQALQRCARCGGDHKDLVFQELLRPVDTLTHWTACPTTLEPILLRIEGDGTELLEPGQFRGRELVPK